MKQYVNNPDRAIKFGTSVDHGIGPSKTFPFFYGFVPRRADTWIPGAALAANLTGIGPTVPFGGTIQHQINLDDDYNFLMLGIKYTAYFADTVAGQYEWYDDPAGWDFPMYDYQTAYGTPLVNFLNISVSVVHNSRYLYGGHNLDAASGRAGGLVPLSPEVLQGYEYGIGSLRTRYFLPKSGILLFEITNTHASKNLVVGGAVYGLKVRI